MDRVIVYPGQIPLDTDILFGQQAAGIALGWLAQTLLADTTHQTVGAGLTCRPTSPASMSVVCDPGTLMTYVPLEANAYGSIAADNVNSVMKMGINVAPTPLGPMVAPATAGQSVVYLVQAAMQEIDTDPVVLPYVDASNPAVPFSGPSNTAAAQFTRRRQRVNIQLKEGTPATTGSQTTPSADDGYSPMFTITIANGATSVVIGNIALAVGAPPPMGFATLFGTVTDITGSRVLSTNYANYVSKPMFVSVVLESGAGACEATLNVGGIPACVFNQPSNTTKFTLSAMVPVSILTTFGGGLYSVSYTGTAPSIVKWIETQ